MEALATDDLRTVAAAARDVLAIFSPVERDDQIGSDVGIGEVRFYGNSGCGRGS